MKRILVPMDFSTEAHYALEVAKEISQRYPSSEIVLLNVIESPTHSTFSASGEFAAVTMDDLYVLKLIEKTRDQMSDLISSPEFNDLDIKVKIKVENTDRTIPEDIAAVPADLIIMGSTRISGMEELLMGSTAEKVVRHATCPVITIKTKPQNFNISNIVFPSSFKEEIPAFAKLKEMQKLFGAKLHLLYINTSRNDLTGEKARERMERFAKKENLENYTVNVQDGLYNEEGISLFSTKINADVIAMATHARRGFLHFIMGSLTQDLVNHSQTMTFTFHMKEETHA